MKSVAITIDMEPDYPPDLGASYLGIEDVAPRLLDLLHSESVPATIFLLAELCEPFPSLAGEIVEKGFHLGNHGLHHELLCLEDWQTQSQHLRDSTRIIQDASNRRIDAFRAPNFSIGNYALNCLGRLNYKLDSSILPGRRMLKHRLGTVYDFRGASSHPYHPSPDDFKKPGLSPILEIPVTENPLYRQTPIGAGFLNTHGPEETLRAIGMVDQPLTILIIHPWEFINLWDKFPHLPKWIRRGCRENLSALSELIDGLRGEGYGFLDLEKVCDGLAKTDSECVALH